MGLDIVHYKNVQFVSVRDDISDSGGDSGSYSGGGSGGGD